MKNLRALTVATGLLMSAAAPAAAGQQSTPTPESRWAPWLGCWQVSEESVQDTAQLLFDLGGTAGSRSNVSPGTRVCVEPSNDGGVTISTLVNGNPILVETMVADGRERPINDSACRGTQKAEWSQLGPRLFARAEIACGDNAPRVISGFATMVTGPLWLDIQLIESQGQRSLRVRRYRPVNEPQTTGPLVSARGAAMLLGRKLSLEAIREASSKVPVEALQAAVLELGEGGYDLKAKQLLELDAAGVPDSVIDLMIGMSFPKKFVVEHATASSGGFSSSLDPYDDMWPYLAGFPYIGMSMYSGHPLYYSPWYSSFYSPFGYHNWGYYNPSYPYYGGGGGIVVINPGPGGGTITPSEGSGIGRVVDGRGYTRVRPNVPEPNRVNSGNGNSGWGTSSTSSSGGSSSGSGSSGVSSGGYSSGGSSGGGERTAVPRPPGN